MLAVAMLCATGVSAPMAADSSYFLPLFPPASHPNWEGFARIINHSDSPGTVRIIGIDDEGIEYGPIELVLEARESAHFNSGNLETGDSDKGLPEGLGDGEGDWRLRLESDLDIEALSYVRTGDGFVTAMHEVIPAVGTRHHVRFFNPGSNRDQVSRLRLINSSGESVEVTIAGRDDNGDPAQGTVRLTLGSGKARTLTAQALESGDDRLTGSLGDGTGKWQLFVSADSPIHAMSLLRSPTGHLSNLSAGGNRRMNGLLEADPSIDRYLTDPVQQGKSPGLFAAIVDKEGVRVVGVAGVRRNGSPRKLTVNDWIRLNSNTKAMTSTMLATLIADGTFARGWQTTIADVFPELLEEIHQDYHFINLRQLVTMSGGLARDATDWWALYRREIIETRYQILRENLGNPPVGSAGKFFYSNLGYMVAGAMAERVTGKSWETLMKERLFAPLGMTGAGFGPVGSFYNVDEPWGHSRDADSSWLPMRIGDPPSWGPAGTVNVSIADWAKFIRLWFLDSEPAILDRSTLNYLSTPDSGDYAAGWGVVNRHWAGGGAISHNGANCCWRTVLWVAPIRGVAYVAAANSYDAESLDILNSIILRLINHDLSSSTGLPLDAMDDVLSPDWDAMGTRRSLRRFGTGDSCNRGPEAGTVSIGNVASAKGPRSKKCALPIGQVRIENAGDASLAAPVAPPHAGHQQHDPQPRQRAGRNRREPVQRIMRFIAAEPRGAFRRHPS